MSTANNFTVHAAVTLFKKNMIITESGKYDNQTIYVNNARDQEVLPNILQASFKQNWFYSFDLK